MADKVRINEKAMAVAEPRNSEYIARTLNSMDDFVENITFHKKEDIPVTVYVRMSAGMADVHVQPYSKGEDGLVGFDYSWLTIHTIDKNGQEDGMMYWLKDLLREPKGPYCVYQIAVNVDGRMEPGVYTKNEGVFLMHHPCKYDVFETISADNKKSYIGITKQGVRKRWKQHIRAALNDRKYPMHRFLYRQFKGQKDTTTYLRILRSGLTFEQAMHAEEKLVDAATLYPDGLNAIPGGFKGLRFLAERNFKTSAKKMNENREREFKEFCRSNPNNPLLALRLQSDDELIGRIICGNPRNFDIDEVRHIRILAELGISEGDIAKRMEASKERIHNLLTEKTYSRVA